MMTQGARLHLGWVGTVTGMSNDRFLPMLKTVEQMQKVSGLGVKKLMSMIHNG